MTKRNLTAQIKRANNERINNYEFKFLKRTEFKDRKSIYISHDMHSKIADIVGILGDRELSIGAYIENVLKNHIETHREEINMLINKKMFRL